MLDPSTRGAPMHCSVCSNVPNVLCVRPLSICTVCGASNHKELRYVDTLERYLRCFYNESFVILCNPLYSLFADWAMPSGHLHCPLYLLKPSALCSRKGSNPLNCALSLEFPAPPFDSPCRHLEVPVFVLFCLGQNMGPNIKL